MNGHRFIAQELNRQGLTFRQHDNAFLAVANPQALEAADRFTPERIRERLEYWTWYWVPNSPAASAKP